MWSCHVLWGWGGWRPRRRWLWLWHCWGPGWGGSAWWPPQRGQTDCRAPTTGGWKAQQNNEGNISLGQTSQLISGLDTDKSQFVPLKSWFCFVPTYCLAAHLKGNCATQTTSVVSYPRVMQASLTTWERRSLADSLNAASMSRSCCRNPSNSAAPARSSERTFFSWRNREREEGAISKDVLT